MFLVRKKLTIKEFEFQYPSILEVNKRSWATLIFDHVVLALIQALKISNSEIIIARH